MTKFNRQLSLAVDRNVQAAESPHAWIRLWAKIWWMIRLRWLVEKNR